MKRPQFHNMGERFLVKAVSWDPEKTNSCSALNRFSVHDCKHYIGQIAYKVSFDKGKLLVSYKQIFDLNVKAITAWEHLI